jgi:2-polyprenyl-6-methoxyphenol hydroxylase-like FAD-dependent oxidoreductase
MERRRERRKTAVVSGQSVSGMIASAILAHAGYNVLAIERRSDLNRAIQWAGRQSLIDQLSTLSPRLADRFLDRCGVIYGGSIRVHLDGRREVKAKPLPRLGNPHVLSPSAHEMLDAPACFLVAANEIERLLRGYLGSLPNASLHLGKSLTVRGPSKNGMYSLLGGAEPDLIVIAEGANSSSRSQLGIEAVPTSPQRLQVAGQTFYRDDGSMIKQLRLCGDDVLETGTIAQRGRGSTWVVGDVGSYSAAQCPPGWRGWPATPRHARLEFASMVAHAIDEPVEKVLEHGVWGPGNSDVDPRTFHLQQHLVRRAVAGSNVILLGDAVGNGHWNEGGGMQIGAICHAERLRQLLQTADSTGRPDIEALERYSEGVVDDTRDWGERGIASFYPMHDSADVVDVYRRSVAEYRAGSLGSPGAALTRILRGSQSGSSPRTWDC